MAEHHSSDDMQTIDLTKNKFVWIIGIVVLLAIAAFAVKAIFFAGGEYRVTLIDGPKEGAAGNVTTFTWRVDGPPAVINHTSVHYGLESNPGELGKEVKPADTKYTDFVKDFANGSFNIPLQFIGNTVMPQAGKYYFRVHAVIKDKNYWSDEYTIDVKPAEHRVSAVNIPAEIAPGVVATFTWRVDGPPTKISSTTVYYGEASEAGKLGKDIKPADTSYTESVKDFIKGEYDIPLQFVGNTTTPKKSGTYYYRVYALVGSDNLWSDEGTFTIK
jgi:hypothetical protein